MLIIVGPSASGKTEVATILISKYKMKKLITCTTRAPRVGEVLDVDYHFMTFEEFDDSIKKNEFVETTFYNNNYYGTLKKDVSWDKVVVLDSNGANYFYSSMPNDVVIIYLNTPLEERIQRMIDRHDSEEEIKRRTSKDANYFAQSNFTHIDYVIENRNMSLNELTDIIYGKYEEINKNRK